MRKTALVAVFAVILMYVSSSCFVHKSPLPTAVDIVFTPTAGPEVPLTYSPLNYSSDKLKGDTVIDNEADYLANYGYSWIIPDPVPTPVNVDFDKYIVIGVYMPGICSGSTRQLDGITTNGQAVIVSVTSSSSNCPGMSHCLAYDPGGVSWYTVDRMNLPVKLRATHTNICDSTTTTWVTDYPAVP